MDQPRVQSAKIAPAVSLLGRGLRKGGLYHRVADARSAQDLDQGKEYAAFIDAELKAERDRRASVNTRAAAALTGATGLVTVVLAVFAVFIGKDKTLSGAQRSS